MQYAEIPDHISAFTLTYTITAKLLLCGLFGKKSSQNNIYFMVVYIFITSLAQD